MNEQFNRFRAIDQSLVKINALLQDPGGTCWPERFRLLELPTQTPEEGIVFIQRSARVARLVDYLSNRILPNLRIEKMDTGISIIKSSVERREKGGFGLTKDILDRVTRTIQKNVAMEQTPNVVQSISTEPEIYPMSFLVNNGVEPTIEQRVKEPEDEEKTKSQKNLATKILLAYFNSEMKKLDPTLIDLIAPFIPLGSDLSRLIGKTSNALTRDEKIMEFIVQGIKTVLSDLYTKSPKEYSNEERWVANGLVNMSSNNEFDIREIVTSIYQRFNKIVPFEYQSPSYDDFSNGEKGDKEVLNSEDRFSPTRDWIGNEIRQLISIRGSESLTYRQRTLLAFLDTFENRILYEDDHLLIIDKPAGLTSHYGSIYPIGIIEASRYKRHHPLHLAHRLDADTSGVLMMVKSRQAFDKMKAIFANKEGFGMEKIYLAILEGEMTDKGPLKVGVPIAPAEGTKMRIILPDEEPGNENVKSKNSTTIYFPLAVLSTQDSKLRTLAEIQIITGRTHQIRVVSADFLHHPVVGDNLYGTRNGVDRSLLHARKISFVHPFKGTALSITSPVPEDFSRYLLSLDWVREVDEERLDEITINNQNNKCPAVTAV